MATRKRTYTKYRTLAKQVEAFEAVCAVASESAGKSSFAVTLGDRSFLVRATGPRSFVLDELAAAEVAEVPEIEETSEG